MKRSILVHPWAVFPCQSVLMLPIDLRVAPRIFNVFQLVKILVSKGT